MGKLWDAATGQPLGQAMQHQGPVHSVAYSLDGKSVLTGGGGAWLWDVASGRPLGYPLQHQGWVDAVMYSSDGKRVLTFDSRGSDAVRVWDAATGQPIGSPLAESIALNSLAFSPNGETVPIGGRGSNAIGTPRDRWAPDGPSVRPYRE